MVGIFDATFVLDGVRINGRVSLDNM